jgi:hypothetical protein
MYVYDAMVQPHDEKKIPQTPIALKRVANTHSDLCLRTYLSSSDDHDQELIQYTNSKYSQLLSYHPHNRVWTVQHRKLSARGGIKRSALNRENARQHRHGNSFCNDRDVVGCNPREMLVRIAS